MHPTAPRSPALIHDCRELLPLGLPARSAGVCLDPGVRLGPEVFDIERG